MGTRRQMFSDRATHETDWPRVAKILIVIAMVVAAGWLLWLAG